jgi:SAM-dependent methyltransferase
VDAVPEHIRNQRWNRNIHYHGLVLNAVPDPCGRALDVGCGSGLLAGEMAERCGEVVAIDVDPPTLARAKAAHCRPNLTFAEGDVMTHPLGAGSFDFIGSIATLHHLPLEPALLRMRELLRPGGVLVVIGLYRFATVDDYVRGALATFLSLCIRLLRGTQPVNAPTRDPDETLAQIRSAVGRVLPGSELKREFFYRYSLVWRKP